MTMIDPVSVAVEVSRGGVWVGGAAWLDGYPTVEVVYELPRGADALPLVLALHGLGQARPARRVEVISADGWEPDRPVYADEAGPPRRLTTVVDPRSGAFRLIRPLRKAGVRVTEPSASDVAAATGEFLDRVESGAIRCVGSAALDAAIRVLQERKLAGSTAWDRFRSQRADVAPAGCCILAAWGLLSVPRQPEPDIF